MGSAVTNATHAAVDQVKDTASNARGDIIDLGVQMLRFINSIRVKEARAVDNVLDHIGLQRRESMWRPMMFFAAGAVAGVGIAVVLAPTSGKVLRKKVRDLLGRADNEAATPNVVDVKPVDAKPAEPRGNGAGAPS